jgi:hypothetical protein
MGQPALSAFRPVVQSSNFEHWRDCLQQVMGDCRVSCSEHDRQLFQASIQVASVGPLTAVQDRQVWMALRRQSEASTLPFFSGRG